MSVVPTRQPCTESYIVILVNQHKTQNVRILGSSWFPQSGIIEWSLFLDGRIGSKGFLPILSGGPISDGCQQLGFILTTARTAGGSVTRYFTTCHQPSRNISPHIQDREESGTPSGLPQNPLRKLTNRWHLCTDPLSDVTGDGSLY